MKPRSPLPFALLVVIAAVPAATGAWATSSGDPTADRAARVIEEMRTAPAHYDFSGVAAVVWRDGGVQRRAVVEVQDAHGSLTIEAGDAAVYDRGDHTYVHDETGWASVLAEPEVGSFPAPGRAWQLAIGRGRSIAGRPTTAVIATRAGGEVAERLFVDNQTGLLLRREVIGRDGRSERTLEFRSIAIGDTKSVVNPRALRTLRAQPIGGVPDGYRAPANAGAGYLLLTRSRHSDGVSLFYSDGLFTVSVFEQRGELDWDALPDGGTTETVAGNRSRRYAEPSGDVLVWERDGVVFTCVSDAPHDVFDTMVAGLTESHRSTTERIVDFVLGPFGWS